MPHPVQYRGSRKFYLFQLWFLVPGILLIGSCTYFPLSYLYRQIYWTRTEASVIGPSAEQEHQDVLYVDMVFADIHGAVHLIRVDNETYYGNPDKVPLYYNPKSPGEFEVVNHLRYLMVIFIPFGLFLAYLGWPHRDDKEGRSLTSSNN